MAIWMLYLLNDVALFASSHFSALDWHMHEMLYGFLSAAIAGFLLTAVPNWTGRPALRGLPLFALVLLWAGGRLLALSADFVGPLAFAAVDGLFPLLLVLILAREILTAGNWRNLPVLVALIGYAASNLLFHGAASGLIDWQVNHIAFAAVLLIVLLIALIGGRITPNFTRNWLAQNRIQTMPASFGHLDRLGMALMLAAAVLLLLAPENAVTAIACLAAALLHFVRLARWRGLACFDEPMLFILHVGFAWIGLGFLLAGLAILLPQAFTFAAAVHAFTAGAMGAMVLAVMTRATRGHTGAVLSADRGTSLAYVLVNLSALVRVGSAILPWGTTGYLLSAGLWIASFSLFVALYLPMLVGTRKARAAR